MGTAVMPAVGGTSPKLGAASSLAILAAYNWQTDSLSRLVRSFLESGIAAFYPSNECAKPRVAVQGIQVGVGAEASPELVTQAVIDGVAKQSYRFVILALLLVKNGELI